MSATALKTTTARQCEANRSRALNHAHTIRERIKRELDAVAWMTGKDGALRAAEILEAGEDWSRSLTLERLLGTIAGVGTTKAKTLARTVNVDPALACRDIDAGKLRGVAIVLRARAAETAARGRTAGASRSTTPPNVGFEGANRVRFAQSNELHAIADAGDQQAGAAAAARLLRTKSRDPNLQTLKVSRIIKAITDVGPKSCEALLTEFRLSPAARLGQIEPRTLGALASRIVSAPTLKLTPGSSSLPEAAPDHETPPQAVVARLLRVYPGSDGHPHAVVAERRGYATVIVDYAYNGAREVVYLNQTAGLTEVVHAAAAHVASEEQPQLQVIPETDKRWVAAAGRLRHVYNDEAGVPRCVIVRRSGAWNVVLDYSVRSAKTLETFPAGKRYQHEIDALAREYAQAQRSSLRAA